MSGIFLKQHPEGAASRTSADTSHPWHCRRRLVLVCSSHGGEITVPCGRWRSCRGCAVRLGWQLRRRFEAGIEGCPGPALPMFFTLTFDEEKNPSEDDAHRCLRSLVGRLRYRDQLGPFGWVLQRQKNGVLHYHGIAHMPWQGDGLKLWRELIVKSGFGVQNRLEVARIGHASYCARYISRNLAQVAPLRRAYSFSPSFPRPSVAPRPATSELEEALFSIGAPPMCDWGRSSQSCAWVPPASLDF